MQPSYITATPEGVVTWRVEFFFFFFEREKRKTRRKKRKNPFFPFRTRAHLLRSISETPLLLFQVRADLYTTLDLVAFPFDIQSLDMILQILVRTRRERRREEKVDT